MSSQPSVEPLEQAIANLDSALQLIARIEDEAVARDVIAQHVCSTLSACYAAWQLMGDAHGLSHARQQAETALQASLAALQDKPSQDERVEQACRVLAPVFGVLRQLAPGFSSGGDLPRANTPIASVSLALANHDAPRLTAGRVRLLEPVTLIPSVARDDAEAETPAVRATVTSKRAKSKDDVEALLAAASRMVPSADAASATKADAEAQPAAVPAEAEKVPPRLPEHVLHERAQSCWEDMAALCGMREVGDDDTWGDVDRTEQRLLARFDALLACGVERLATLTTQLAARPIADPELTWALMLSYGSLSHRDAADQCVRLAATVPIDDADMLHAITDAFALAPHPRLDEVLPRWLAAEDENLRAIAVGALSRRRRLSIEQAHAAMNDQAPSVVLAGLAAVTHHVVSAAQPISGALLSRVKQLLVDDDEAVVDAALQACVTQAPHLVVQRATELIEAGTPDFAHAILWLALCANGTLYPLFERAAREQPSPLVFEALGWYGATQAFDPLLAALQGDDEALVLAAAHALNRLSNAPLSADSKDLPKPLVDHTLSPFPTPQVIDEPCIDPEPWHRFLSAHRASLRSQARYRWGRPYTLLDNLWELETDASRGRARRLAHLELIARSGINGPFDRGAFVHTQRQALAAWRDQVQTLPLTAGAWPPHQVW